MNTSSLQVIGVLLLLNGSACRSSELGGADSGDGITRERPSRYVFDFTSSDAGYAALGNGLNVSISFDALNPRREYKIEPSGVEGTGLLVDVDFPAVGCDSVEFAPSREELPTMSLIFAESIDVALVSGLDLRYKPSICYEYRQSDGVWRWDPAEIPITLDPSSGEPRCHLPVAKASLETMKLRFGTREQVGVRVITVNTAD